MEAKRATKPATYFSVAGTRNAFCFFLIQVLLVSGAPAGGRGAPAAGQQYEREVARDAMP